MKLTTFFKTNNLEHSLLFGYYGGGNYGDELLLEVLANMMVQGGIQNVTITYQNPEQYKTYHHDFGYPLIEVRNKVALIKAIFKNKNIIIGGGGLWGVDMNFNTFLLSLMLWVSRWVLGKKVHLIGVGYYNSTNKMGHRGAWLAGKAANTIIARDNETFQNFAKISGNTYIDTDIAWYINGLRLNNYQQDLTDIEAKLPLTEKTIFIALRRIQSKHRGGDFAQYNDEVEAFLKANQDKPVIIGLLESEDKSPDEYAQARAWQKQFANIRLLDFPANPLALFLFFRKNQKHLLLVAPQFHIIITAYLTHIPFMPMVYDNKVEAMLESIGVDKSFHVPMKDVTKTRVQAFADQNFGGVK